MFFGLFSLKPLLNVPEEGSKLGGSLAMLEGEGVSWAGLALDLLTMDQCHMIRT